MKEFTITALCDKGSVRTNNEDMILVKGEFIRDATYSTIITMDENAWIAVSDGMGGHNAGEMASEFVLRNISKLLLALPVNADNKTLETILTGQIREVHASLNQLGLNNPDLKGLGCTFTGILLYEGRICSVHIGDSRLYRLRPPYISQFTKDHTLRNMLNDPNVPPNIIANSLGGGSPDIFLDFEDISERLMDEDILLLCSDGLSGELNDETIEQVLMNGGTVQELVTLAKEKGGNDNISCVLIRSLLRV